jgi:YegS/Rv2252/BmrU family lipid kinase
MLLVVCNPKAGGGKSVNVLQMFERALKRQSVSFETVLTSGQFDLDTIQKQAKSIQPSVVVIIGGDGTIHDVVNATYDLDVVYHVLPAGSGNDFGQLIDAPLAIEQSVARLLDGKTRKVDVGKCNNRFFMNGLGIGFDGEVAANTVLRRWKFIPTTWKYWIEIFKQVLFYQSKQYSIAEGAGVREERCFMISVANGRAYGGGFQVAPRSEIDDGLLDLVIIKPIPPLQRLLRIPLVEKGKHLDKPYVEYRTVREITINSTSTVKAHLDGEIMEDNHFVVRIAGQRRFIV